METLKVKTSRGNFLRISSMEYGCIDIPGDQIIYQGQKVIIYSDLINASTGSHLSFERTIVDFDLLSYSFQDSPCYLAIVKNC